MAGTKGWPDTQGVASAELEDEAGNPNFMTSLARGLSVIRAFSERSPNLTIADIAKTTGIPRAAARRCLLTLMQLGYAGSDGRTFHLRPKVLALGYSFLSSTPLTSILGPLIEQVSNAVQESCSAAVLDDDEIVYIARAATKRIMSVGLNVGSRLPAYCTSMGRVLLAGLPEAELDAYLQRVPLTPFTERTITDPALLKGELERVRESGFALVNQELELGLRSIAVPIRTSAGAVVAALNISTQAARISCPEMQSQLLPQLLRAADEARALLAHRQG